MSFKSLSSKLKDKLDRRRSRSRSPSLGNSSIETLPSNQTNINVPNVVSSAPDSFQAPAATAGIAQNFESLPILTITEPDLTQESSVQQTPVAGSNPEHSSQLSTISQEEGKLFQATSELIWDRAYDELKTEDAALVQAYETILSTKLQNAGNANSEAMIEGNIINQHDREKRRIQMNQLVKDGLDKISLETKVKLRLGRVLQTVNLAQSLISDIVNGVPQAALPWAAVCLSLEVTMQ